MAGEAPNPAEAELRKAIAADPNDIGALQRLAILLFRSGRAEEGIAFFQRAAQARPDAADVYANLGAALASLNRMEPAAQALQHAAAIYPDLPRLQFNLGNVLLQLGRNSEAAEALAHADKQQPNDPATIHNLGTALRGAGRISEAVQAYRRATQLAENMSAAFANLGITLQELGQYDEAIKAGGRAVALEPGNAELHAALGHAFRGINDNERAAACYRQVILLRPLYAPGYFHLGNVQRDLYGPDSAVEQYRRAIELDPNYAEAYRNLASTLRSQGMLDESIAMFRKGAEVANSVSIAGNLLYTFHFHPDYNARKIFEEAVKWNERYIAPIESLSTSPAPADARGRRLRIGYVSPDLRNHPVGWFMLPLLAHHDRTAFEVNCYADSHCDDDVARQLRSHTDGWRSTIGISDEQLARQIRDDQIDILIDLSLHPRVGRLPVFALRPAPVQVTYLAYCSTSGLRSMDFRISDPYLDPPGTDLSVYFEQTIRLPKTYWCYPGSEAAPPVVAAPALANGYITFGCMNLFAKVNPIMQQIWAAIMVQVPGSRLLVHAPDGSHRELFWNAFETRGILRDRIRFVGFQPTAGYFAQYNQIDIALDTWPYGGGTTTCDTLWMGVPVVSSPSDHSAVSRGGASILNNIGLPELCGEDYVGTAVKLAADTPALDTLRQSMRARMLASPLMDAPGFARDFETALRTMWNTKMNPA